MHLVRFDGSIIACFGVSGKRVIGKAPSIITSGALRQGYTVPVTVSAAMPGTALDAAATPLTHGDNI